MCVRLCVQMLVLSNLTQESCWVEEEKVHVEE